MLLDLADERPPDHLPAADVVRARNRVEQGDEASGDVRPERLTANELGSARWSAHWIQELKHWNQPVKYYASRSTARHQALSHHQHVVIVMRDVRHVAERLPHALAEGVDRRAERIF